MGFLKKKKVVITMLTIMLVVAGILNYNYDDKSETSKILGEAKYVDNSVEINDDNTDILKMKRDEARDTSIELLKDIINNQNLTKEAKEEAEKKLIKISEDIKVEVETETLLLNRGFKGVIVTMNDNGVTVSISAKELLPTEIAQITDVIVSQANITSDKIKISTRD